MRRDDRNVECNLNNVRVRFISSSDLLITSELGPEVVVLLTLGDEGCVSRCEASRRLSRVAGALAATPDDRRAGEEDEHCTGVQAVRP